MQRHCQLGADILAGSPSEILKVARVISLTHHEWWDGSGYPKGLAGEKIPLFGRICAVADVFDALTSRRPYKEPIANEHAYAILREGRGRQFDPRLVECFLACTYDIEAIQEQFRADRGDMQPLRIRCAAEGYVPTQSGMSSV